MGTCPDPQYQPHTKPSVVMHTCDLSAGEAETVGNLLAYLVTVRFSKRLS